MLRTAAVRQLAKPRMGRVLNTRQYSTPAAADSPATAKFTDLRSQLGSKPLPNPNLPPPKRPFVTGRALVWIAGFTVFGFTLGKYASSILAPEALPLPFSPEDLKHKSELKSFLKEMKLVREMTANPDWESWEAYEGMDPARNDVRLTTGPLAAPGCIGHQQVFHNKVTDEYVVIVHLGKALSGWPGVVHGGLSCTLLDECCGRAALACFTDGGGMTANLNTEFKKPVLTGGWWLIRAKVDDVEPEKRHRKATVTGTVEDLDGNVFVKTKGIFVAPKGGGLKKLEDKF